MTEYLRQSEFVKAMDSVISDQYHYHSWWYDFYEMAVYEAKNSKALSKMLPRKVCITKSYERFYYVFEESTIKMYIDKINGDQLELLEMVSIRKDGISLISDYKNYSKELKLLIYEAQYYEHHNAYKVRGGIRSSGNYCKHYLSLTCDSSFKRLYEGTGRSLNSVINRLLQMGYSEYQIIKAIKIYLGDSESRISSSEFSKVPSLTKNLGMMSGNASINPMFLGFLSSIDSDSNPAVLGMIQSTRVNNVSDADVEEKFIKLYKNTGLTLLEVVNSLRDEGYSDSGIFEAVLTHMGDKKWGRSDK